MDNKSCHFASTVSILFPDLSIPPEIHVLIFEYENDRAHLHANYKCKIAPNIFRRRYSTKSLLLFKLLRITSNIMLLISFAWYLDTWYHKQNSLFDAVRTKFVSGVNVHNILPVPADFDRNKIHLSFTERLRRAYRNNPFDVTTPTIPLTKYLILPFSPKRNVNIKWKYWNNKYNLLAFVSTWYFFEVLHNFITHRCYMDFTQFTEYLKPKYSHGVCEEMKTTNVYPEMHPRLKTLYWKWRCLLHNHHHQQFYVTGTQHTATTCHAPVQGYQFFLAGKCLAAVALLHTCTLPCSQLIGYLCSNFNFYKGRFFFLTGNEKATRRLAYYAQSMAIYAVKGSSVLTSCCLAGILWHMYPVKLGMSGAYNRYRPTGHMICRNQMRNRYKTMCVKLMLLLSGLTYANNFISICGVFCYGLLLGESMECWVDSRRQFARLRNELSSRLPIGFMVDISKQYNHRSMTRLVPLLMDVISSVLLYALVGTPERLQLQAVGAYKSRKVLNSFGIGALVLGLITHLGNASYLESGYYYNFHNSYSRNDVNISTREDHPPPRDLFESVTFTMIQAERLVWSLYKTFREFAHSH